jgi:acetyl-CoA acyltransferase
VPQGISAELIAEKWDISREDNDRFSLESHLRAARATDEGRFEQEIIPVQVAGEEGTELFSRDEGIRPDSSLEKLASLKPAFKPDGVVTAGNSSQISDGAAAVIVMSAEKAKERGLEPMGRFVTFATAGVEPERFGIGPVPAIQKALKLAGLRLEEIDLIELNEAFAAQVLACLKALPIDPEKLNVNGGAIALGHPLGCTGAKLTTSILYEMKRRNARYGMVTMCVGGGMGAAGIFERL